MEADRELILEDAHSISDGLWRLAQLAQDATELLDACIEEEALDGQTEVVEVRGTLERVQALRMESRGCVMPT